VEERIIDFKFVRIARRDKRATRDGEI